MQKMSLERFKEIKNKIIELIDTINKVNNGEITFTKSDEEQFEKDAELLFDEIHCSDLSDIPFEEYEGFIDLGFDFEGTKANLDFNLIDLSQRYSTVRAKGCNIRNFDFESHAYDGNSFDETFVKEHPDMFLNKDVPDDVKSRFYARYLSIADILTYELYDDISKDRFSKEAKQFFTKVPTHIAKTIDTNIFINQSFTYLLISKINDFDEEINVDTLESLVKESIEEYLNKSFLPLQDYKKMINIPKIREFITSEKIIDFGENDELGTSYLNGDLSINDIITNLETFRSKKFIHKISNYSFNRQYFEGITEEKIYYLFDNYPDISEALIFSPNELFSIIRKLNPEISTEENLAILQDAVFELLNRDNNLSTETQKTLERYYSIEALAKKLSEHSKYRFDKMLEHTTAEKISSYGIPTKLLEDDNILYLFSTYGLETIMEFDKVNGNIFSKNDFSLIKNMHKYYLHYAGNEHDPDRTIFYRGTEPQNYSDPYTIDDFEECVRRMIVFGPSDYNYSNLQPIDFRDFSDSFKTKYPRMFLKPDAPYELQDKFYTKTIEISDFTLNPDWIDYLEGIDYEVGMQMPRVSFRNPNTYNYYSFSDILRMVEKSESNILNFLNTNSKTIKMLELYTRKISNSLEENFETLQDLDSFKERIETEVENRILSGELEYGEPYLPDFFKEKHPDLVLDENAPEELKAKFYSLYYEPKKTDNSASLHNLTLEDLTKEEYQPFLAGKSFDLVRNADQVKNITKIFDIETITDLYKIDPKAFEVYCFNIENANILKEAIQLYPEQYAREELMQAFRLNQEEFEDKLLSDSEFKAKFDTLKRAYLEDLVRNPGFVLYLDSEKRSRESLRQYKALSSNNMLHTSNRYSRDSYEQILGHMLGFLGYDESRKLLEVPEIDEDTLSRIYEQDEIIKSLYEKKFEITGNIKVISKLFEGIPNLMPTPEKITSKTTCKIFLTINKKIQEGYDKNITSLLNEVLAENNIPIDTEKINQLSQSVIEISTAQKLDLVREHNSVLIDTNIEENQKTKNMIKMHYRNALEYSLNASEKIDPKLVREYLEKEFSRIRDDNGEPYYSSHVTSHLEELVEFAINLALSPEWNKKLNHSIIDDLKEESIKIGKGWIRKITTNVCYKPEKMTYEDAERLDAAIYPEGSGLEVETKPTIGLKKLSEEEKSKVYTLLTNDQFRGLFSYGKAENMFSTLNPPYSQKFKEFFLKHKDEFIGNPDLYAKFPILASKFESYLEDPGINTRYTEGTLTPEDVLLKLSSDVYPNLVVDKGEHEVIYQARNAGLTEEQAKIALKLFQDMKKREYQTMPQEQFETKRFRGRIVRMDDPLHFAIGEITNCCQTIGTGQPGESSMVHSATERNGALFIVEELDETGKSIGIVSQSWTWRNGNRVCFDNVEIPHKVEEQLKQVGGFDEIMEIYQNTATRMIETDKIKLRKLVDLGKITEEQFRALVIKDVTMGLGCDNLVGNLSTQKKKEVPSISTVSPIELGKTYTGAHSRTLYSDSGSQVLIAHNDDFSQMDHIHTSQEVGNYGIRYTKTRDIFRRKGFEIDSDKIDSISTIVKKSSRKSVFQNNPISIVEIAHTLGIHDIDIGNADILKISMSENGDWYILSEETPRGIIIHETGVDLSKTETETETLDRKMALGEYTREMYKIMLEAASQGKSLILDIYSIQKLFRLDDLIKEEIISVRDGTITITNTEKLTEKINSYNQILDAQRRERLTVIDTDKFER